MKSVITFVAATLCLASMAFCDQTATTKDGRTVVLKEDGTWTYVDSTKSGDSTAGSEPFDFRKTKWGMSMEDVRGAESWPLSNENDDMLLFGGRLSSFEATAGYIFVGDQLVRSAYLIDERHSNKGDYLTDYHSLNATLSEKYGTPTEDEYIWKNDLYQDDPQRWGLAIAAGHLAVYTEWQTEQTVITHFLVGDNYDITHKIEYKSVRLEALEEEQKKADAMSDL